MFFGLLLSALSGVSAYRIFNFFEIESYYTKTELDLLRILYGSQWLILTCTSFRILFASCTLLAVGPLLLFAALSLRAHLLEIKSQSLFPDFLCDVLFLMKAGFHFRQALRMSNRNQRWILATKIQFLIKCLEHPSQESYSLPHFWKNAREIFLLIDESPQSRIPFLDSYREELQRVEKFRRKSRKALFQVRFQAATMTFLYVVLAIWLSFQNTFKISAVVILISFTFFIVGIAWMLLQERSFRWSK